MEQAGPPAPYAEGAIDIVRGAVRDPGKVFWKAHALTRMRERNIKVDDLLEAVCAGRIIERHDQDSPFPSVLVCGFTKRKRPLHAGIGVNAAAGEIHMVTGYEPDPARWDDAYTARRPK